MQLTWSALFSVLVQLLQALEKWLEAGNRITITKADGSSITISKAPGEKLKVEEFNADGTTKTPAPGSESASVQSPLQS